MEKKEFYTAGELAKLTGVSYKTIRHYYEKGLLIPKKLSEGGYRLYGREAMVRLQRILMLKYLDFSLEKIAQILDMEDSKDSFDGQVELLRAKKEHLELVLGAVEEIQKIDATERWEKMLQIIQMTTQKEEIVKQYKVSDNLQKRINIHEYSTAKEGWYPWVLKDLELRKGMKILEIGCGTGTLWSTMRERLPENLLIIMTDNSEGMLTAARAEIGKYAETFARKNIQFVFQKEEAENLTIKGEHFDRVIANHVLYHISNDKRQQVLQACAKLLKEEGMFYASTVGETHLRELFALEKEFDSRIEPPTWVTANFTLENGGEQLEKVFSKVMVKEHENDLLIPNAEAVYHYAESWPGNSKDILAERGGAFLKYLKSRISEEKAFFCHKSTGAFKAFL